MFTQLATRQEIDQTDLAPTIIREDDLQHIEDTPLLYWVTRQNRAVKLSWNEMSVQEQAEQIKAKERADFVAMFDPDYSYAY